MSDRHRAGSTWDWKHVFARRNPAVFGQIWYCKCQSRSWSQDNWRTWQSGMLLGLPTVSLSVPLCLLYSSSKKNLCLCGSAIVCCRWILNRNQLIAGYRCSKFCKLPRPTITVWRVQFDKKLANSGDGNIWEVRPLWGRSNCKRYLKPLFSTRVLPARSLRLLWSWITKIMSMIGFISHFQTWSISWATPPIWPSSAWSIA